MSGFPIEAKNVSKRIDSAIKQVSKQTKQKVFGPCSTSKLQEESWVNVNESRQHNVSNTTPTGAEALSYREEKISDFTDPERSLLGRITIYKINFKKNLRRFQDITGEYATNYIQLTKIVNQFLAETPLPSVWHLQMDSNNNNSNEKSSNCGNGPLSPDLCFYNLNSKTLPLSISFNPLLISYSLFLRALGELAKPSQASTQKAHLSEKKIV